MASKTKIENAASLEKKENEKKNYKKISEGTAGLEPAIFCSVGRRVIRCATHPNDIQCAIFLLFQAPLNK